jgi:hypothetical protein
VTARLQIGIAKKRRIRMIMIQSESFLSIFDFPPCLPTPTSLSGKGAYLMPSFLIKGDLKFPHENFDKYSFILMG